METELTIKNKHYSSYSRIRKGVWSLRCWYPTQARQPHTLVEVHTQGIAEVSLLNSHPHHTAT